MSKYKPIVLMVLDGWGHRKDNANNAVNLANTPFLDEALLKYPWGLLKCSGLDVGLPKGFIGNSEVGHLNIGAGRVVDQDLNRINNSILDKSFFSNHQLLKIFKQGKTVHLLGLLSDGGVHSHISHFEAILKMARDYKGKVIIHPILDGRDTLPMSGHLYLKKLIKMIKKYNVGEIATLSGRYFTMDRDKRWTRTKLAFNCLTKGSPLSKKEPLKYLQDSYLKGIGDEFIVPTCFNSDLRIKKGDTLICLNFRADRVRQIISLFKNIEILAMTQYDKKLKIKSIFLPIKIKNNLGEVLSRNNLKQLRVAETEKYAHVTFFFNSGQEKAFKGEDRILVPSPKDVATYDLKPEMSADLITKKLLKALESNKYDFILVNYANCDMVGHSGLMKPTIKAVEVVDRQAKIIAQKVLQLNGLLIISADHGNAEMLADEKGNRHTAHTTNPVKCIIISQDIKKKDTKFTKTSNLADLAPSILKLLNIKKPQEMSGNSLIK